MREPTRLCDGGELPVALRDAFRALEREAPSAEVVARVQGVLHALPAATPGALSVAALSGGKLLALVTVLVGSIASVVLLRGQGAPARSGPAQERAVQASDAPARTDAPVRTTQQVASTPRATPTSSRVATPATTVHALEQAQRPEPNTPKPSGRRARDVARSRGMAVTGPHPTPPPLGAGTVVRHETPPAQAAAEPSAAQAATTAPSAAATQAAEARLLAQAKRLAAREPEAALRQVEALARQFPDGVFVQERALLAIQLHRQLGHAALVEQLTRQFQEHYPRSVYRRALPP